MDDRVGKRGCRQQRDPHMTDHHGIGHPNEHLAHLPDDQR